VGVTHACGAVAHYALSDEVDIVVVIIGWPMVLEIVEEDQPVGL
jgi:hypothetical protein